MAEDKTVITFSLKNELLEKVEDHRHGERISTRSEALNAVIDKGLAKIEEEKNNKK